MNHYLFQGYQYADDAIRGEIRSQGQGEDCDTIGNRTAPAFRAVPHSSNNTHGYQHPAVTSYPQQLEETGGDADNKKEWMTPANPIPFLVVGNIFASHIQTSGESRRHPFLPPYLRLNHA